MAVKLNYRQYSDSGPPLLILHGLFGSLSNWGWHSKQLADSYAVYGVDLRNHGDSPHAPDMNYPLMARDVAGLLGDLGIASCAMIGHSMGGKVAMQLALTEPGLLDKLAVVDIAPVQYASSADGHLAVLDGMAKLNFEQVNSRRDAELFLRDYIKDEETRQFVLTNLARGEGAGKETGEASGKDGGHGEGNRYHWRLNLEAITANYDRLREKPGPGKPFDKPTLFIKGALSNYIQAEHERETLELFPRARVKVIMETGHWVHAEKPQAVQKILRDFLANPDTSGQEK